MMAVTPPLTPGVHLEELQLAPPPALRTGVPVFLGPTAKGSALDPVPLERPDVHAPATTARATAMARGANVLHAPFGSRMGTIPSFTQARS